jgi:hypothetical protein
MLRLRNSYFRSPRQARQRDKRARATTCQWWRSRAVALFSRQRTLTPESHKRCFAAKAKRPPFKAFAFTGTGLGHIMPKTQRSLRSCRRLATIYVFWLSRLRVRRLNETARPSRTSKRPAYHSQAFSRSWTLSKEEGLADHRYDTKVVYGTSPAALDAQLTLSRICHVVSDIQTGWG